MNFERFWKNRESILSSVGTSAIEYHCNGLFTRVQIWKVFGRLIPRPENIQIVSHLVSLFWDITKVAVNPRIKEFTLLPVLSDKLIMIPIVFLGGSRGSRSFGYPYHIYSSNFHSLPFKIIMRYIWGTGHRSGLKTTLQICRQKAANMIAGPDRTDGKSRCV